MEASLERPLELPSLPRCLEQTLLLERPPPCLEAPPCLEPPSLPELPSLLQLPSSLQAPPLLPLLLPPMLHHYVCPL